MGRVFASKMQSELGRSSPEQVFNWEGEGGGGKINKKGRKEKRGREERKKGIEWRKGGDFRFEVVTRPQETQQA